MERNVIPVLPIECTTLVSHLKIYDKNLNDNFFTDCFKFNFFSLGLQFDQNASKAN